jgi:hypothetical protein
MKNLLLQSFVTDVRKKLCLEFPQISNTEKAPLTPHHTRYYHYIITTKLISLNPADHKNVGPAGL